MTEINRDYIADLDDIDLEKLAPIPKHKGNGKAATEIKPAVEKTRPPLFDSLATLLATPRLPRWLVKRLIETPSTMMFFGPSGAGKSFVAVDLAGATATSGQWAGHDVIGGPVYYIAGEGRTGLLRRFQAWQLKRRVTIPSDKLFLSNARIEMNELAATEIIKEFDARAKETGEPPSLVVVDTLARALPFGADENTAKDMGAFLNIADRIRDHFECVVVIVHHAGVADDRRARGSTSLKAAVDGELCIVKKGATRIAEWTKLKDLPEEIQPQEFALEPELLGQDEDGNFITSPVVSWRGKAHKTSTINVTKTENLGMETLRAAIGGGDNATLGAWRTAFYAKHWGDNDDSKKKSFQRIREALAVKGLISIDGAYYSIPAHRDSGT